VLPEPTCTSGPRRLAIARAEDVDHGELGSSGTGQRRLKGLERSELLESNCRWKVRAGSAEITADYGWHANEVTGLRSNVVDISNHNK
jgi:hypothetical protein